VGFNKIFDSGFESGRKYGYQQGYRAGRKRRRLDLLIEKDSPKVNNDKKKGE